MKLNPYLSPYTNFNSKWIKDLLIRPETLYLIDEKVGPYLYHVGLAPDFLNKNPKVQEMNIRVNKWAGFKLKSFFLSKGNKQ